MRDRLLRLLPGLLVAALVVGGTLWLRGRTLTRHETVPAGSSLRVVIDAHHRESEADHELPQLVASLVGVCQVEVRASLGAGGIRRMGPDRFSFTLVPTLDRADRRQLRGCIADFRIDHVLASVISMEDGGYPREEQPRGER